MSNAFVNAADVMERTEDGINVDGFSFNERIPFWGRESCWGARCTSDPSLDSDWISLEDVKSVLGFVATRVRIGLPDLLFFTKPWHLRLIDSLLLVWSSPFSHSAFRFKFTFVPWSIVFSQVKFIFLGYSFKEVVDINWVGDISIIPDRFFMSLTSSTSIILSFSKYRVEELLSMFIQLISEGFNTVEGGHILIKWVGFELFVPSLICGKDLTDFKDSLWFLDFSHSEWVIQVVLLKFGSEPKFEPEPLGLNSKFSSRFRIFAELNLSRLPLWNISEF